MLAADPDDAHGAQDDARHAQAHLHHGQQEQAPQDVAAGAHPAAGIAPAPAAGGQRARERSALPGAARRGFTAACPKKRGCPNKQWRSTRSEKARGELMKVAKCSTPEEGNSGLCGLVLSVKRERSDQVHPLAEARV